MNRRFFAKKVTGGLAAAGAMLGLKTATAAPVKSPWLGTLEWPEWATRFQISSSISRQNNMEWVYHGPDGVALPCKSTDDVGLWFKTREYVKRDGGKEFEFIAIGFQKPGDLWEDDRIGQFFP